MSSVSAHDGGRTAGQTRDSGVQLEGELRRRFVFAKLEVLADDAVEAAFPFYFFSRANNRDSREVVDERACELLAQSRLMVEIDVRIADKVGELVGDAAGHVRDEVREESGVDDVEGEAKADVGGSLVDDAGKARLGVDGEERTDRLVQVELVQDGARRHGHVVDICAAPESRLGRSARGLLDVEAARTC